MTEVFNFKPIDIKLLTSGRKSSGLWLLGAFNSLSGEAIPTRSAPYFLKIF